MYDEKARPTLPVFVFVLINKPFLTPSYEVAYLIAKQGKPHTFGEKLLKRAALMTKISMKSSVNARIKLAGFGTSDKFKNHCSNHKIPVTNSFSGQMYLHITP